METAVDVLKTFMNELAIDETVLVRYLPHPDLPNMGPLIRTGGQQCASNLLPRQTAYPQSYFTDMMWPHFDRRAL